MNKINRKALLEMALEADCYRDDCGFAECDLDSMERFAELVLASQEQQTISDYYAGVVIWIGDAKVAQVVSKEKMLNETVSGMEITNTAQNCLDTLAAAIRARSNK